MGRYAGRLFAATVVVMGILTGQAGMALASASSPVAAAASAASAASPGATKPSGPVKSADSATGDAIVPGFDSQVYGANDDGSYPCTSSDSGTPGDCDPAPIDLPFPVTYYGAEYDQIYLNNNGNLTFGEPLSQYTPESLNQLDVPMIAPFWSDVDTRAGATVTFGEGTVDGHDAFGVNWFNVGCFSEIDSVTDAFQLLLISRPDLGDGDWQIEFNYGPLTWDSGQASGGNGDCLGGIAARAGYTDGEGSACELPGSGVNSGLLDTDPVTGLEYNGLDSDVLGRYIFSVSGDDGQPDGCDSYWALGDSYSSGEGTEGPFDYTLAGFPCDRSTVAWPELLDESYAAVPPIEPDTFIACSGDVIDQIVNGWTDEPVSQVDQLRNWVAQNGEPSLVTATGGGNDLDFEGVLSTCVLWGFVSNTFHNNTTACVQAAKNATTYLESGAFTPILTAFYRQVVDAAQGQPATATPEGASNVVIVGYPNLLPTATEANAVQAQKSCPGWMGSTALDILSVFQHGQAVLNQVQSEAAQAAGVRFVPLGDVFAGHELCTPDSWLMPLAPTRQAGHPTYCGQAAIADAVAAGLGYLPTGATASAQCQGQSANGSESASAGRAHRATGASGADGIAGTEGAGGKTVKKPGPAATGDGTASRAAAATAVTAGSLAAATSGRSAASATAGSAQATPVTTGEALGSAAVGYPYDGYLWATGGTAPFTWSVTGGTLPAGLTLSASTGIITGTPTAAGSTTVTVTATDSSDPAQTARETVPIDVLADAPVAVTTGALPAATAGQHYSATLAATGGIPAYTWQVTSGTLPAGLTLDASAGVISGTPTAAGTSTVTLEASDSTTPTAHTASASLTLVVVSSTTTLAAVPVTLPGATVGDTYSQVVDSTGGTGPVSWSVVGGALPTGLTIDPVTGTISGVATQAGAFTFTAQVRDTGGNTAAEDLSITIAAGAAPTVDTTPLPGGTQGQVYSGLVGADGGVAPYTWAVTSGSLPPGLTLDAFSGTLSGTPTAAGTYTFAVTATDSSAAAQAGTASFTVTIAPAPAPPALAVTDTVTSGAVGAAYDAALLPAGGTGPYSYAVTSGSLPAGLTLDPSVGTITGTPTTAGTSTATITVTDSSSLALTATDDVPITIAAASALATITSSLPAGNIGAVYAVPVTATGGTGADTFAVTSGTLPAGLTLDPVTGIINGTPSAAGSSTFTVTVTDSATPTADTAAVTLTLTIAAATPVAVDTTALPDAQQGASYSESLFASGGARPYNWTLTSGSLPDGLAFGANGVISGTPTGTGAATFTVQATDSLSQTATESLTITVNAAPQLAITTTALPEANEGAPYFATLDAEGGTVPYTWSVSSGSLPDGLTLDGNTIGGTPDVDGTFTFTFQVTDSSTPSAQVATEAYTLTVSRPAPLAQAITFIPPASGTYGGTATLSATGGGSGNPVVFTVAATSGSGVCTVSGTHGTTLKYTGVGTCVIDANQAGNAGYLPAPKVQRTVAVGKAATRVTLAISGSSVTYGHEKAVTFKATVTATGSTPTGTVTFKEGTKTLCAATITSGVATCGPGSATLLTPGTYQVTASYGGGIDYATATSSMLKLTVAKEPTKTTVTTKVSSITYGKEKSLVITVTVTPQYSGTTVSGTITITDGRITICTNKALSHGRATCTPASNTTLPKGTAHIVATYAGNADYASSRSAARTVRVVA